MEKINKRLRTKWYNLKNSIKGIPHEWKNEEVFYKWYMERVEGYEGDICNFILINTNKDNEEQLVENIILVPKCIFKHIKDTLKPKKGYVRLGENSYRVFIKGYISNVNYKTKEEAQKEYKKIKDKCIRNEIIKAKDLFPNEKCYLEVLNKKLEITLS